MNEMTKKAYDCIITKNTTHLDEIKFHPRIIIEHLKNNTERLEFFLDFIGYDPGAGSYFFTDIEDNMTFDLYKKYGIEPINLYKHDVTSEQWKYMHEIDYIDDQTYEDGFEDEDA